MHGYRGQQGRGSGFCSCCFVCCFSSELYWWQASIEVEAVQAADRQRQYGQQLTGTGPRVSGEDEVVCWCFHHDTAGGLDSFMKACPCQHCCDHVCVCLCVRTLNGDLQCFGRSSRCTCAGAVLSAAFDCSAGLSRCVIGRCCKRVGLKRAGGLAGGVTVLHTKTWISTHACNVMPSCPTAIPDPSSSPSLSWSMLDACIFALAGCN